MKQRRAEGRLSVRGHRLGRAKPAVGLAMVAPVGEERADGHDEPDVQGNLASVARPGKRGPNIVQLVGDQTQPGCVVGATDLSSRNLGQVGEVRRVAVSDLVGHDSVKLLEREFADRLQQAEARLARGTGRDPQETLVDRRPSASSGSTPSRPGERATASAAPSVKPPTKTDSRASKMRSAGSRRP